MSDRENALNLYSGNSSSYYLGGMYTGSGKSNSGSYYNIDGKRIPKNCTDPFGIQAKAEAELKEKWNKMEKDWLSKYKLASKKLDDAEQAHKGALKLYFWSKYIQRKKAKEAEKITQGEKDLSHLSTFDQIKVKKINKEISDAKDLENKSDTDFAIAGMEIDWTLHDKTEAGRQVCFIDYFKPDDFS